MKPATVKKWHTTAFRLFWRWKSKPGRPEIEPEMQALIRKLSAENPLWGAERIRQQLGLPGYDPPCTDTILKYMARPRRPGKPSTTWLPFLRNHLDVSWAIDFCTVPTLSFRTLFILIVLEHGHRKVLHWAVTPAPSMAWVVQQLSEAMPYGVQLRYLFRDNDGIYGHGARVFLDSCGIKEVRTAFRSPWQNPFIERYVGTLRKELPDHVIVLNERHLERLLTEFVENYYHAERRTKDSRATRPPRTPRRPSSLAPRSSSPRPSSAGSITPTAASPPERVPCGFGRSAMLAGRGRATSPRWQNGPSSFRCALIYSLAHAISGPKPISLPSATRDAPLRHAPHCPRRSFSGKHLAACTFRLPRAYCNSLVLGLV